MLDPEIRSNPAPELRCRLSVRARMPMEIPMVTHSDHHITDTEDAAFDATMKIIGAVIVLLVIVGVTFWYIYS
jgi:hypothetical protein